MPSFNTSVADLYAKKYPRRRIERNRKRHFNARWSGLLIRSCWYRNNNAGEGLFTIFHNVLPMGWTQNYKKTTIYKISHPSQSQVGRGFDGGGTCDLSDPGLWYHNRQGKTYRKKAGRDLSQSVRRDRTYDIAISRMSLRYRCRSGDGTYAISQSTGRNCDIRGGEMTGLMRYHNRWGETKICHIDKGGIYDFCDPWLLYWNRRGEELSQSVRGDQTLQR